MTATTEWYQCVTGTCLSTLPCPQGCVTCVAFGVWQTCILQLCSHSYFFHSGQTARTTDPVSGFILSPWAYGAVITKASRFVGKSTVEFAVLRAVLFLMGNYCLPMCPTEMNRKFQEQTWLCTIDLNDLMAASKWEKRRFSVAC